MEVHQVKHKHYVCPMNGMREMSPESSQLEAHQLDVRLSADGDLSHKS